MTSRHGAFRNAQPIASKEYKQKKRRLYFSEDLSV